MDPNETLRQMRHFAWAMDTAEENGNHGARQEYAEEIALRFLDLDEWLSKGGFLPEDWSKK